ncbi:MAG TPA: VOC family protein [Microvirga sp.]|jgi:catechol 2,3-dioxygenase-like lactoylglutathione lyase family enzyme|nr:VOC family protein [Microvirga sp.]
MTILARAPRLASAFLLLATLAAGPLTSAPARSAPAPASGMSSAAIRSDDVDATVRWYRDTLGFRVIADRSLVAGRSVVLERRGMLLEIAESPEAAPMPRAADRDPETTAAIAAPAVSVLVADVDREVERLRAAGASVYSEPDDDLDGRFRTAWVVDRDRRIVELREPLTGGTGITP